MILHNCECGGETILSSDERDDFRSDTEYWIYCLGCRRRVDGPIDANKVHKSKWFLAKNTDDLKLKYYEAIKALKYKDAR